MAFRNTFPDLTENEWKHALCMAVFFDETYGPQRFVDEYQAKMIKVPIRVLRRLRKLTPAEIKGVLEVWEKVRAYMKDVAYGRLPRPPNGMQFKKLIAQWEAEKRSYTQVFSLFDD